MNETTLDIVGGLTADPELRYTQSGIAVANFTIATTQRVFDRQSNDWKDGDQLFLRCTAWRELAEHITATLTKGARVLANVSLKTESYETKEGEKRTAIVGTVNDIGPSLRYATAVVTKTTREGGAARSSSSAAAGDEPWATSSSATDVWNAPGTYSDETPF